MDNNNVEDFENKTSPSTAKKTRDSAGYKFLYAIIAVVVVGSLSLRVIISPIQCVCLPVTLIGRVALGVSLEYILGNHQKVEENILYRAYNVITMPVWLDALGYAIAPRGC